MLDGSAGNMSDLHHIDPSPRLGADEQHYLLKRAEDHRRLAEKSNEPGARAIHLRLERLYQEQATLLAMVFRD